MLLLLLLLMLVLLLKQRFVLIAHTRNEQATDVRLPGLIGLSLRQ